MVRQVYNCIRRPLGGGLLALLMATGAPQAEDRASPMQFWMQSAPQSFFQPSRPSHPTFRPRRASTSPATRTARHRAPSVASSAPAATENFVVAVFGDSLGQDVARGLTDALKSKSGTTVVDATRDDAALTQDDATSWSSTLDATLRRADHLDAAVVLVGASDDDSMIDSKGQSVAMNTPEWRQLYGDRVERLAALFKDRHIPLVWVGLPVVRDGEQAHAYADINAIVRDRAEKLGATFVDTWEAFTNDAGQYDANGPDINGNATRLRRSDGQRFTTAGARKLASFVEPDLKRVKDRVQAGRQLASLNADEHALFDQALQVDINAQIRREAGLPVAPSTKLPLKDFPVVELTATPLAPDGRLATVAAPLPITEEVSTVLDRGEVPQPRRGRTDDFSWPERETRGR